MWDTIGCRRLAVLVRGLPPDSAFHRRGKAWTQAHELAALQVEKTEARLYQLTAIQVDEKSRKHISPPITITHPHRPEPPDEKRKATSDPAQLARFFGRR